MEPQLGDLGDEAEGVGAPVELRKPRLLLGTQLEDDVLAQVGLALPLPARGSGIPGGDLSDRTRPARSDACRAATSSGTRASGRPAQNAKTKGRPVRARHSAPRSRVGASSSWSRAGSPITSAASAASSMRSTIGAHSHVLRVAAQALSQEDLHEGRAGPARGVQGDPANGLDRAAVEQSHRAHGAAARDGDPRHDGVAVAGVFDRRDHPEVDRPPVERLRQERRDLGDQLEPAVAVEAVDDRGHVEVGHDSQPEHARPAALASISRRRGRRRHHSFTTLNTVSRSMGRRPASRIRRQSS